MESNRIASISGVILHLVIAICTSIMDIINSLVSGASATLPEFAADARSKTGAHADFQKTILSEMHLWRSTLIVAGAGAGAGVAKNFAVPDTPGEPAGCA